MRHPFGEWAPDLPPIVNGSGLTVAKNCIPTAGGYAPINGLATVSNTTALASAPYGAITGVDTQGNAFHFAATATDIYQLQYGSMVEVSKSSGGYSAMAKGQWSAVQFDDTIIFVNPNDPPQYFNLNQSAKFDDLDSNAPRARHIDIVGPFTVMGNIFDPVAGLIANGISWSGVDNPFSWPTLGTDISTAVQAGRTTLEGNGGWVQAIVAGAEIGAIFQEHAVWRMSYVGGDVIFNLDRVEPDHGLLIPGAAAAFERNIFYIAEDGFRVFNYTQSSPIGKNRIDSYFFDDLDTSYLDNVSVIRDPAETRIYVGYPGSGNTGGRPNKMIVYDWVENRFGSAEIEHDMLCESIAPTVTLDTTPDDDLDAFEPTTSFDERLSEFGSIALGAYGATHQLSDFSGVGLAATFETGDMEMAPGGRAMVSLVRPLVDTTEVSVQVAGLRNRLSQVEYSVATDPDDQGDCPQRVDGRYHRFKMNLNQRWTNAVGFDVVAQPTGMR